MGVSIKDAKKKTHSCQINKEEQHKYGIHKNASSKLHTKKFSCSTQPDKAGDNQNAYQHQYTSN